LREGLVREVRQRRSSPQGERLGELGPSTGGVTSGEGDLPVGQELLEAVNVNAVVVDSQRVSAATGDQQVMRSRAVACREILPKVRYVDLQALSRRRRWPAGPQLLDQPVRRHDLIAVQQEEREQ
jgi:hypothetical protein